ncbi:MAG: LysR substrate-binding domain-containing protein [Xanthobacteraceae bacterium]|nr:LysR substrate-binding domain-containing protein [Xanthobacteraceae bacterium]
MEDAGNPTGGIVMQFRQLRYFVKIVEAGSFSRAASVVHVAQPALSQQIAELEERLGVTLLQRTARGVLPTAAGDILYKEASVILHQLDKLPGLARARDAAPEGAVGLSIMSSLAPKMVSGILEECRKTLPKVTLRVSDGDSLGLERRIASNADDIAVIYEDEFVTPLSRKPLFTQRLFLVSREPLPGDPAVVSLQQVARLPIILPGPTRGCRRDLIDRMFAESELTPTVALEADSLSSELWAVRSGVGSSILPAGDMSQFGSGVFAKPVLIEPAMVLSCSIVHSGSLPLTSAAAAVHDFLIAYIKRRIHEMDMPGTQWVGDN